MKLFVNPHPILQRNGCWISCIPNVGKITLCWEMHQKWGNNVLKVCPCVQLSVDGEMHQSTFTGEFNIHNGWQVDGLVRDKFVCFYFCWFLPSSALSYVWLCSFFYRYTCLFGFCVVIFISVCRYMHGSFDSIQTCFYDGSSECLTYLVHMYYLFTFICMCIFLYKCICTQMHL